MPDFEWEFEWGIAHRSTPNELHRGPMTREQAEEWIRDWVEECGPGRSLPPGAAEAFLLIKRGIRPWVPA